MGEEGAYRLRLEPLDEDAVEERDDGLDGLERCLGSLLSAVSVQPSRAEQQRRDHLNDRDGRERRRRERGR